MAAAALALLGCASRSEPAEDHEPTGAAADSGRNDGVAGRASERPLDAGGPPLRGADPTQPRHATVAQQPTDASVTRDASRTERPAAAPLDAAPITVALQGVAAIDAADGCIDPSTTGARKASDGVTVTGRAVWSYAQTTAEACGVELDLQLALVPDKRVPARLRMRARDVPRACP